MSPPAAPAVPPIIRDRFPGDADADGIDDRLAGRIEASATGSISSAASDGAGKTIGVELIFRRPVTQEQIDAFLNLGGEITYLYRAISYGWNGRIDPVRVSELSAVMGSDLVQVIGTPGIQWRMDLASQSGRVRPIWKPGFAGNVDGFKGDPGTTIAFIDTGIDGEHADMAGRCAYWNDLSGAATEEMPADIIGHGTAVAGVAVGTGESGGNAEGVLTFTFGYEFPTYGIAADPITLPPGTYQFSSVATWDGVPAMLDHAFWEKGGSPSSATYLNRYSYGWSPRYLTNQVVSTGDSCYAAYVYEPYDVPMRDVAITNTISPYPCVGDGFNTFSGVAPQCSWAVEVVPDDTRIAQIENVFAAGLDDLVAHRADKRIKIINLSAGLIDEEGLPLESVPFRDKINSAVRNGIVVVVAAGNSADSFNEAERAFGDPERAALAICVGASGDENALTEYSSHGFLDPQPDAGEDFKPDLIAPGGSRYYSGLMSVDTGGSDGAGVDVQANDYANAVGTSLSSPFVAGCAALVIEAMERQGIQWDFNSDWGPRFVKMLLCATASETNAKRESNRRNPSLERAAAGPEGFPAGKDRYEGYGLINPDAAVEAVSLNLVSGVPASDVLGAEPGDRRVWARALDLAGGMAVRLSLENPEAGDFDLYLYSAIPSESGTPVILASSTSGQLGGTESIHYTSAQSTPALVVVKRVSGAGTFELTSVAAGPPVARSQTVVGWINTSVAVTLEAADDGLPDPPAQLSYTIASLPKHGRLEQADTGAAITTVPALLSGSGSGVIYIPHDGWTGRDTFTFYADDGGQAPQAGRSNTATVRIDVLGQTTVSYQVAAGEDDSDSVKSGTLQSLGDSSLRVGSYLSAMRFCNVDIPQGAEILSAVLKVHSHTSMLTVDVTPPIYAEAADDAGPFGSNGRRPNSLTKTEASVIWDLSVEDWERNTWYDSPDISSVVQEVIDRPGWSAQNAIVIIWGVDPATSKYRRFWSYDGAPASAPILEITYKP